MVARSALAALVVTCIGLTGGPPASADATTAGPRERSGGSPGPASSTGTTGEPLDFRAPVLGDPAFARPFRAPAQRWSSGHRGLDLWLDVGTPVLAPADGTVTFAGTVVDRGVVTVLHPDGRRTSLEPVDPGVVVGQRVAAGDVLGTLQAGTHCPARSCLHWGLREGDRYLDPLSVLSALPGGGQVVLLPLAGPERPATAVPPAGGTAVAAQPRSASTRRVRRRAIAAVCICEIRDSVTPSSRPISARVRPS